MSVRLRGSTVGDLDVFYDQERDPEALRLANLPSRERGFFTTHWTDRVLGNPETVARTVLAEDRIAGHIVRWIDEGDPMWDDEHVHMVSFWFGREFWGRGIGTAALRLFLAEVTHRPLHAEVAAANLGAVRVLEKCDFTVEGFADVFNHHGDGTVEYVDYILV